MVSLCILLLCGCMTENMPVGTTNAQESAVVTESTKESCEAISPTINETVPIETTFPRLETEPMFTVEPTVIPTEPSETEPEYTEPPTTEPEKTLSELISEGVYTLKSSYDFYNGSMAMSEIQTITFSKIAPSAYDEFWIANVANTDGIVGYRIGTDVIIVGDYIYANSNCRYMFAAKNNYGDALWSSLVSINGLDMIDMSAAANMSYMFYGGKFDSLQGIGSWNTGSAYEMKMLFAHCTNITSLNIGSWNVSNVHDFTGMFQGHDNAGDMKLQYLDIGRWDTSSAFNMSYMFYGCGAMTHISVENWNVSNVGSFSHMFADCFSLQSIDFSRWETLSACSFNAFLNDCRSLTIVDVSGLDTAGCIQFSQMFEACVNLHSIVGLETLDVSSASDYAFSETFHCCYALQEINIGSWISSPDNTARMFKNCYALTKINMSGFDMTNNVAVTEMFMGCGNLTEVIGMDTWNLESATGYDSMCSGTIFDK